jgi:exodeoxyribonuclease VII small subunit
MTKKSISYSDAVEEINEILSKIENGDPDVDELTGLVNRALDLIKQCQQKLRVTEMKINSSFDESENAC